MEVRGRERRNRTSPSVSSHVGLVLGIDLAELGPRDGADRVAHVLKGELGAPSRGGEVSANVDAVLLERL